LLHLSTCRGKYISRGMFSFMLATALTDRNAMQNTNKDGIS